jgi:FtsP/CotA-like multicopper oxidase with cupredoxin domain
MRDSTYSRRSFLKTAAGLTAASLLPGGCSRESGQRTSPHVDGNENHKPAAYTLRIAMTPVELASGRVVSMTAYNGQFPGPLLRLKEGKETTIEIYNDTNTPEQLHWHGQQIPSDVDGSAEEGTPFIPPHGMRRITFTSGPSGLRFYHTHNRAGANLSAGQYGGQVGPVYIEPSHYPGNHDQEVFLVLKEFEPSLSRGGDMAQYFLSPSSMDPELKERGESSMKASLAKGMPHGFEVGYASFTINGRILGHGEPIRVNQGQRVLIHVVNGSATEIRSLAIPGHTFRVVALDGNPVPNPKDVPVLWIGTAERVSAIVKMNYPGVWILGDLADDDRMHGMVIVVEYAGQKGIPQWVKPPHFRWDHSSFANAERIAPTPDETLEMTFAKDNAAEAGFNRWTINGIAYPPSQNDDAAAAPSEARPAIPHQDAKCERRHPPCSSSSPHF